MCPPASKKTILAMKGVGKRFPGVEALKDVDFDLVEGEVHSLVGANGAGKSTLVNILCGVFRDYTGSVTIDGRAVRITSPRKSHRLGVSVVSQDFSLVEGFSVAENIYLNCEPQKFGFINRNKMIDTCDRWLGLFDIRLDPAAKISSLSVVECQLVEIIKALQRNSRILIMDEPTAVLSSRETSLLYGIIEDLKERAISIILISHRFEDIFEVANRVTVLCAGRKVFNAETGATTVGEIVGHMLGKQRTDVVRNTTNRGDHKILAARSIGGTRVRNVSFELYSGEVLGVIGGVSSGTHELLRVLCGAERLVSGTLHLDGREMTMRSPAEAIQGGIGFLSGDRGRDGIFRDLPVTDNITMPYLKSFAVLGCLQAKRIEEATRSKVDELNIRVVNLSQCASELSGGSQQKVILARWLCNKNARIFLFEEPTRGVDVGSKTEIYQMIHDLTKRGNSCIVVSSELDEILLLCDRILVMNDGMVSHVLRTSETSKTNLLKMIMGS